jgi:16S rRNA (cytosine1402-N4)-methyltransferase
LGGHTELILRASPGNRVIGLDRDAEAIELARERLAEFGERFTAIHTDYRRIKEVLGERGIETVAGIVADLGVSSYQLDTPERGFSFRSGRGFVESPSSSVTSPTGPSAYPLGNPLDMRMDRSQKLTAADLVNGLSERELADIIFEYGEERAARRIAHRIVAERAVAPITTTGQLADLVIRVVHPKGRWRVHPATKTFQALRIAVNRELDGLDQFIADAVDLLEPGGRLVVITFHSLEDRIIKQALRFQSGHCLCPPNQPECRCGATRRVETLTRKAIQPGEDEIASNPRSRSAKLRACRKI